MCAEPAGGFPDGARHWRGVFGMVRRDRCVRCYLNIPFSSSRCPRSCLVAPSRIGRFMLVTPTVRNASRLSNHDGNFLASGCYFGYARVSIQHIIAPFKHTSMTNFNMNAHAIRENICVWVLAMPYVVAFMTKVETLGMPLQ